MWCKSSTTKKLFLKTIIVLRPNVYILQNCVTYFTSELYRYDGTKKKNYEKNIWIPSYVQILTSTGVAKKKKKEWMNVCIKWSSICFSFIDGMVLYDSVRLYTISKTINQMHQPSVKPRLSTGRRVRDIIFFFV